MKKLILYFLLLLLSVCLVSISFFTVEAQAREAYYVNTSPGGDMSTSMNVHWHSDVDDTYLEYTLVTDTNYESAIRVDPQTRPLGEFEQDPTLHKGFADADRRLNSAYLTDLEPGTRYMYRVGKTSFTENFYFTTATPGDFTFVNSTDIHDTFSAWNAMMNKAYEINPDIAFNFVTGDTIDNGGNEDTWTSLFNTPILRHQVKAFGVGNHEYSSLRGGSHIDNSYFNSFFNNPKNGPELVQNSAYYFRYNNALFIMLDGETFTKPNLINNQKAWFKEVMEAHIDVDFTIVGMHRSLYGGSDVYHTTTDASATQRQHWLGLFDMYGVDLVLSGHCHVYARTHNMYNNQINEDPNRGTTYIIGGKSGAKNRNLRDSDLFAKSIGFTSSAQDVVANLITVTEDSLSINLINLQGETLDTHTINKKRIGTIDDNFSQQAFLDSIEITYNEANNRGTLTWDNNFLKNVVTVKVLHGTTGNIVSETYLYNGTIQSLEHGSILGNRINNFKAEVTFGDGTVSLIDYQIDTLVPEPIVYVSFLQAMDSIFDNFAEAVRRIYGVE